MCKLKYMSGNVRTITWVLVDVGDIQDRTKVVNPPARWQRQAAWVASGVSGTPRGSAPAPAPAAGWPRFQSPSRRLAHPLWTAGGLWRSHNLYPAPQGYLLSTKKTHLDISPLWVIKPKTGACVVFKKCSPLFSLIRWIFQKRKQSMEAEDKQLAISLGSIHSDGLFFMNTTLPLAVSTEKGCRQAVLPARSAQGSVAGHRVSWIRDIVSVSELQLLWRGQTFKVAPLVVGDTRPRNTSFAWRRRRCVIPRIVIVRTFGLAR